MDIRNSAQELFTCCARGGVMIQSNRKISIEKVVPLLSASQWSLLKSYMFSHAINFCGDSYPTLVLFQFIQHRTINWNKVVESFTYKEIRIGNRKYRHSGTGLNDKSITRAKKFLLDKGVIQIYQPNSKKIFYRLNLIGIIQFVIKCEYPHRKTSKDYPVLLEIFNQLKPIFKDTNNEINFKYRGKSMQLKNISDIVDKQTKAAEIKRIDKLKNKKLNTSMLPAVFKQSCDDSSSNPKFSTAEWVGRDWGNAKNFLNECKSGNKNPRLLIKQACDYWWKFRTKLTSENGKGVMLDEVVNFRQFFNFRGPIQTWLQNEMNEGITNIENLKKNDVVHCIPFPNGDDCIVTKEEYNLLLSGDMSYQDIYELRKKQDKLPEGCMEDL